MYVCGGCGYLRLTRRQPAEATRDWYGGLVRLQFYRAGRICVRLSQGCYLSMQQAMHAAVDPKPESGFLVLTVLTCGLLNLK